MLALRNYRSYIKSLSISRNISHSRNRDSAYKSDGKTTVTVLNKQPGNVMIDSYSEIGFRLNNGVFVCGPMVLFPRTAISWNVEGDHDIHKRSLQLFTLIEPKLDLIVIGYGNTAQRHNQADLHSFRVECKLNMEVLPVEKAIATFNYLVSEDRWVVGAFIPPAKTSYVLADELLADIARSNSSLLTSG